MKPDNLSEIENEIRETAALEASSAVTDLPNTVARNVNPFAEKVNHTDTGVDVVVDVNIDADEPGPIDPINVDIDDPSGVDIDVDVETHVDQ
jgi:hypothetical protein